MTKPLEAAILTKLQSGRKIRTPKRLRSGEIPRGLERENRKRWRFFVKAARGIINQFLIPRLNEIEIDAGQVTDSIRTDQTWDELVNQILVVARGSFEELTGREQVFTPEEMAQKVSAKQKSATIKQFKQLLGVDLFLDDAGIEKIINPFITENVGLIKKVSSDYFDDIEAIVLRNFRAGQRVDVVKEQIKKRTGALDNRAKLIARDQMSKLWGDLARHRQTEAGVGKYIWRTSKDERVRPEHAAREGKVFSWKKPPPDGHPGQAINCRCWAEPMIEEVLSDLEKQADRILTQQGISF